MVKHLSLATLGSAIVLALGVAGSGASSDGMFVIGNGNAATGSQVTFWGAQWWKDNSLSGGRAPSDFKGYALNVDLSTCTFTSVTGNTAPPPDGPLPATIDVVVTGAVAESGSTVSGTVLGIAHVATNGGYGSDPGHAGTGVVLEGFDACTPDSGGGPL